MSEVESLRLPDGAAPARHDVDVWLLSTDDVRPETLDACLARLAPDEQARARRFIVDDARKQFVLARALLRRALSSSAPVPPAAWRFGSNDYGKPRIDAPAGGLDLRFNLSHTHGLVACAVSHCIDVGLDVEYTGRAIDLIGLASALFAPDERVRFDRLQGQAARDYFFSIWTLKEAYAKARGIGMSLPFDGMCFEFDHAQTDVVFSDRCPDEPSRWRFARLDPTPAHKLALALASASPPRPHVRWKTATALDEEWKALG